MFGRLGPPKRGIGDNGYTQTTKPYWAIAQNAPGTSSFSSAGSGGVIGCTSNYCYYITAAHNVFTSSGTFRVGNCSAGQNPYYVFPRRDGQNTKPYGTWQSCSNYGYLYWSEYYVNECYKDSNEGTTDCLKWDIIYLRILPQSGATTPGTMGYAYRSKSWLNDYSKYQRGYPNCGGTNDPVNNCESYKLYGDGALSLGTESQNYGGWPRLTKHSSDSSNGHSGAPVYYYYGSGAYYAFGVHIAGSGTSSKPNTMRRITQADFDSLLTWTSY